MPSDYKSVIAKGVCWRCRVPRGASPSTAYCQPCLDKTEASTAARRMARQKAYVCVDCRSRAIDGTTRCKAHNRINSLRTTLSRAKKEARACAA